MERNVLIDLCIDPIFWDDLPEIHIKFNQDTLYQGYVAEKFIGHWVLPTQDQNRLSVIMLNKRDLDSVDGKDKAVVISKVGLEKLFFPSILYQSRYRPIYSEGYYEYAQKNSIEIQPVIHSNYLGFNGEWYLDFTWPVFSWIYSVETNNLGWVYEKNI